MRKSNFVIDTWPFASQICNEKLGCPDLFSDLVSDYVLMFDLIGSNCLYPKLAKTIFDRVVPILKLWISWINLHHDKCRT